MFCNWAHDGVSSFMLATLPPRKGPVAPIPHEGAWDPQLVWTPWRIHKPLAPLVLIRLICDWKMKRINFVQLQG
jgi:hypothetical protein